MLIDSLSLRFMYSDTYAMGNLYFNYKGMMNACCCLQLNLHKLQFNPRKTVCTPMLV